MRLMNLDKLKLKPNQVLDFDPTECTALAATLIAGSYFGIPFNPDFTYAASLNVQGLQPTTAGSNPRAAMFSGCLYGYLPQSDETFTAATKGELYASNFANYTDEQKAQALPHFMTFKPVAPDWDSVVNSLKAGFPLSLSLKWFWGSNPPTILPMSTSNQSYTLHEPVAWDWQDPRGLTIQPYLGTEGDNGYFYLTEEVYNASQAQQPFCLDPDANRKLQLISNALVFYPAIGDIVKSLVS